MASEKDQKPEQWECGPHTNAWGGHDARCRRVPVAEKVQIRRKCERDGHKFREIVGVPLPYVFCARWRCDASAVSRWADPTLAVEMHNAIPWEKRVPQVELAPDGTVIPTDETGTRADHQNQSFRPERDAE